MYQGETKSYFFSAPLVRILKLKFSQNLKLEFGQYFAAVLLRLMKCVITIWAQGCKGFPGWGGALYFPRLPV